MKSFYKAALAAFGAAGLVAAAGAGTALASTATPQQTPVTASVTVTSSITFSETPGSFTLPAVAAGATASLPAALSYSVQTNDPNGATVAIDAGNFSDGSAFFSASQASVTDHWSSNANSPTTGVTGPTALAAGSNVTVATLSGSGSLSANEDWSVLIPGSQSAGTYSMTAQYEAIAS